MPNTIELSLVIYIDVTELSHLFSSNVSPICQQPVKGIAMPQVYLPQCYAMHLGPYFHLQKKKKKKKTTTNYLLINHISYIRIC